MSGIDFIGHNRPCYLYIYLANRVIIIYLARPMGGVSYSPTAPNPSTLPYIVCYLFYGENGQIEITKAPVLFIA